MLLDQHRQAGDAAQEKPTTHARQEQRPDLRRCDQGQRGSGFDFSVTDHHTGL